MKRTRYRRQRGRNRLVLFTLLFWTMMGLTTYFLLNVEDEALFDEGAEMLGKQYLTAAFPSVSRGGMDERSSVPEGTKLESQEGMLVDSKGELPEGGQGESAEAAPTQANPAEVTPEPEPEPAEEAKPAVDVVDTASAAEPKVLIYHTHATESYMPYSDGNYHSQAETGTVREVGDVLERGLEAKGIPVLHDKTLHDVPSYNKSYSRSLETAKKLIAEHPSIQVVIDLHRDAAGSAGSKGYSFTFNGASAAQFSLVIGQGNANLSSLTAFGKEINQKANAMYPGFARGIIEKDYRYNQYIFDKCLLLELGNNMNDIEQVKRSAGYFAEVLAAVMAGWQ